MHMKKLLLSLPLWVCSILLQAQEPNITGTITCSGVGVEGVIVSDGYVLTQTDAEGKYAFYSEKKNGYVFYTLPSGYMPYVKSYAPTSEKIFVPFWQALDFPSRKKKVEVHDFKLKVENNESHIMIFAADPQVANRETNDLNQYKNQFFPRMKEEYLAAGSTPIYTTVLGDLSWDYYWYSKSYSIANYKSEIINQSNLYKLKHFHVIGNHDHDGATHHTDSTDFMAAGKFRYSMGPNYYSYNLGKIHYVVLDDIIYLNNVTPGTSYAKGIVGDRDYSTSVTQEQLDWLEKDLSFVDYDTPVFVCVHAPFWGLNSSFQANYYQRDGLSTSKVSNLLKNYKTVHFFSGHRHNTYNITPSNYGFPNIREHSIGAVGGNLWWAGFYSTYNNCNDGTPGGWQVFYINGKDIKWQLHSLEKNGNAQMRIIDGNTLKTFFNTNETYKAIRQTYSRQNFSTLENNAVLVNVFNYDTDWKVEIYEGNRQLTATRWRCEDPFHTLTYDIPRFEYYVNKGQAGQYSTDNATNMNLHTFKAIASSATSSITVKLTDPFGNTYTKTATRPIPCTVEGLKTGGEEAVLTGMESHLTTNKDFHAYIQGNNIKIHVKKGGTAVIANTEGMSRTVKLVEGDNLFPIKGHGIYIVSREGESVKLYIK